MECYWLNWIVIALKVFLVYEIRCVVLCRIYLCEDYDTFFNNLNSKSISSAWLTIFSRLVINISKKNWIWIKSCQYKVQLVHSVYSKIVFS